MARGRTGSNGEHSKSRERHAGHDNGKDRRNKSAVQQHLSDPDHEDEEGEIAPSGAPATGAAVADLLDADEIFRRVAATADHELESASRMHFFSGLSAGLSLGVTFLARATLGAETGSGPGLPGDLLYPLGFVLVVLGRYQLFTENTLTPVTLVLARLASIPALLRLWSVVFVANVAGAVLAALLMNAPEAITPDASQVAEEIAAHALAEPLATLFVRAVIAGGLVASMVWVVHAVRDSVARIIVVYGIVLLIPVAGLYHCITGFVEVVFGVLSAEGSFADALGFLAAVSTGNIVGGIGLVAVINYGQTADSRIGKEGRGTRLTWRQYLLTFDTVSSVAEPDDIDESTSSS